MKTLLAALALTVLLAGCLGPSTPPPPELTGTPTPPPPSPTPTLEPTASPTSTPQATPSPTASPTPLPTPTRLPDVPTPNATPLGQAYGIAVCPSAGACPVFASLRDVGAGTVAGYLEDGQVVGVYDVQRLGTLYLCRLDDGGWTECAHLEPCDWVAGECVVYGG